MSAAQNLKPWKPGQSGNPSGKRKKIFDHVDQILKANGKEPIQELLALIPQLKTRDQAQIWLEILPYVHGKVKPEEPAQEGEDLTQKSTAELLELVQAAGHDIGKAG